MLKFSFICSFDIIVSTKLVVNVFYFFLLLIRYILTCGSDGDVRIWEGAEDDDAISHGTGDKAFCVAYKVLNKFQKIIFYLS